MGLMINEKNISSMLQGDWLMTQNNKSKLYGNNVIASISKEFMDSVRLTYAGSRYPLVPTILVVAL